MVAHKKTPRTAAAAATTIPYLAHHPYPQQLPACTAESYILNDTFALAVFGEKRARLARAGRQHAFIVNS
jgi:hypothetical protein